MKNILSTLILSFISVVCLAQTPAKINYQAIARDGAGTVLANETINAGVKILSNSTVGTVVYQETHSITTNEFGLFYFKIGEGISTPTSASLDDVNWETGAYFLNVNVNGDDLGTTELVSVPYSLHSGSTEGINGVNITTNAPTNGDILSYDGTSMQWELVSGGSSTDDQTIQNFSINPGDSTITLDLEDGGGAQVIDLRPYLSGGGSDDQNIDQLGLTGTVLTVGIENGVSQTVDLVSLQDGTGTDNQDIDQLGITGTNLTVGITGGTSQTVDLVSLQDGTGTDNQVVNNFSINNSDSTITLDVQNGGGAQSIDLRPYLNGGGNIYDQNGTLTSNRTVTTGTNALTFFGTGTNPIAQFSNNSVSGSDVLISSFSSGNPSLTLAGNGGTQQGKLIGHTGGVEIQGGTGVAENRVMIGSGVDSQGKLNVTHSSLQGDPSMNIKNTGTGLNRIQFQNDVASYVNHFWEIGAETNNVGLGGFSINYFDGTTYKSNLVTYNDGRTAFIKPLSQFAPGFNVADVDFYGTARFFETLSIGDVATGYKMPSADGMSNYVMQTNGSGEVTWVDPSILSGTAGFWSQSGTSLYTTNLGDQVGIGTTNPTELLYLLGTDADMDIETVNDLQSTSLHLRRARGTSTTAQQPVQNNDTYANIQFQGYNGSNYVNGARILGSVDGAVSNVSMPGRLEFYTTPTGSTSGQQRMVIRNNGNVGVSTSSPNSTLEVNGSFSAAIRTHNGNITLDETDQVTVFTNTTNGATAVITLPSASTCEGRIYKIIKPSFAGGNVLVIQPMTGELIGGITQLTLNGGASVANAVQIISDGNDWHIISQY